VAYAALSASFQEEGGGVCRPNVKYDGQAAGRRKGGVTGGTGVVKKPGSLVYDDRAACLIIFRIYL